MVSLVVQGGPVWLKFDSAIVILLLNEKFLVHEEKESVESKRL